MIDISTNNMTMMTNFFRSKYFLLKSIQFAVLSAVICFGTNDLVGQVGSAASVLYDRATGQTSIELKNSQIIQAVLVGNKSDNTTGDFIRFGNLQISQLSPFLTISNSNQIGFQTGVNQFLPVGTHAIGNVFDAVLDFGMPQDVPQAAGAGQFSPVSLNGTVFGNVFLSYSIQGNAQTQFAPVTVTAIPEPGSLFLLGLAGLAPAFLRRRRS